MPRRISAVGLACCEGPYDQGPGAWKDLTAEERTLFERIRRDPIAAHGVITEARRLVRRSGYDWIAQCLPWGFALADLKMPVAVWHGELDHLVRPAQAHYLSAVLPNATLVLYPADGHLPVLQHWDDILAAVTARAQTRDPGGGWREQDGRAIPP